ncbi:hypothetical protein HJC99_01725 [Candidatus Saccharibacteria bacterium]|nr:hypothetical protein [Candidatus Saccharibacteria bacterium]
MHPQPLIPDDLDTPHYLAERASLALVGSYHVLPALLAIVRLGQSEFFARDLGLDRVTLLPALGRLSRWGLIERVRLRGPSLYVCSSRGGTVWELAEMLPGCFDRAWHDKPATFPALDPALGFPPKPWWRDRLNKRSSMLFAGGVGHLSLLIRCYRWPQPFWSEYSFVSCRGSLQTMELAGMVTGLDTVYKRWPSWQRTNSAVWDIVPLLWRLVMVNNPRPTPAAHSTHPTLYKSDPLLKPRWMNVSDLHQI